MLPSELLSRANSFDVFVAETAVGYENYLNKKESGKGTLPVPELTQEQMQAMIDRVKSRENKSK